MKATVIESSVIEAIRTSPPKAEPKEGINGPTGTTKEKESPAKETIPKQRGFAKGKSGNPSGRPKGALGKSTLIKQAIMAETEGMLLENAPKVIKTVIEQAKGGCLQSQKLIWQSIIPAKRAVEISAKEDGPAVIKINIETLNTTNDKHEPALEAEFVELTEQEEE